jgi:DNA polymerase I-like protein with 3'-5' exonuclease and polymerase domains
MTDVIALDTETYPIAPGCVVPPLVVLSWATAEESDLHLSTDAPEIMRPWLQDRTIIGANIAFDMAVLANREPALIPEIYEAYERDQILDVQILDQLLAIRRGNLDRLRFNLSALNERYLGFPLAKGEDTWRTRYAELDGIPLSQWPQEAIDYSIGDAEATFDVYQAQLTLHPDYPSRAELGRQGRAAFALHLMRAWGVRSDPRAVSALRTDLSAHVLDLRGLLLERGLLKTKRTYPFPGGFRGGSPCVLEDAVDQKAVMARVEADALARGCAVKSTDTGRTAIDGDTLRASEDPVLHALAERSKVTKLLDFVEVLEKGAGQHPFHPRWNVLVATGRTSCGGDEDPGNLQNQPRKGGIRECFIPTPGHVFITRDVDSAELRALAQITYAICGFSHMRDVFLRGPGYDDPHQALHESAPDLIPDRQFAKIPNFGFPGGLGVDSFVEYAKGYGATIDVEKAQALKNAWFARWPEVRGYFRVVKDLTDDWSSKEIVQYGSGRIRGQVRFTQAANSFFQGLVADAMKCVLARVSRECYDPTIRVDGHPSPLYGCRPVAFVHDEVIIECPHRDNTDTRAHYANVRIGQIIEQEFARWMPDVPVRSSGAAMARWYKGAKETLSPQGYLIPWTPPPPKT